MPRDLTLMSTNFPLTHVPEISRDNLVSLIKDMFNSDCKSIVVEGPAGSGKTTLLAQFARAFPDRALSFFIGTTLVTSSQRYFLLDLCEQMGSVLGKNIEDLNKLDELDSEELKQVFHDFLRRLAQKARKVEHPFYFVIDGLELISESEENTLIELLPAEPLPFIYLLISSESNRSFPFRPFKLKILPFSLTDTERYLSDLELGTDDIHRIHKICNGLPAYPAAIRRLIRNGFDFHKIADQLPTEVSGLFDLEWERLGLQDDNVVKLLAVLAYSKEILTVEAISQITGIARSALESIVSTISFLKLNLTGSTVEFASEAHKQYARETLREIRGTVEESFIQYYSNDPFSKSSLLLLPSYLATGDQYEQLKELLSISYMTKALSSGRDIAVLRQTLRLAGDLAFKREDWSSLPQFTLSSSLLRTIAKRPIGEDEVKALTELGAYDQAFEVAYQALLPADRLQLLAIVCQRMQQAQLMVPENVLMEVKQMADTIDNASLRERALSISEALFDLLPDTAIALVERCEGISGGQKALDIARALLVLRLKTKNAEIVQSRISNPALRDIASSSSRRIERLLPEQAVAEADKITYTSRKLFFLVSWCNSNRTSAKAAPVVEKALETITADTAYAPSVRTLRQLAEPLLSVPPSDIARLVDRLLLLKSTSIKAPAEETIRFDLLMAVLKARQEPESGMNYLLEIYFELDSIFEVDTRCYSMARMLLTLPEIDPIDSLNLKSELSQRLNADFQTLIANSANQFALAERMLRDIAAFDIDRAISFSLSLNTYDRRNAALKTILTSYLDRKPEEIDLDVIQNILGMISQQDEREMALVRTLKKLSVMRGAITPNSRGRLLTSITTTKNPQSRAYACAFFINALPTPTESPTIDTLFSILKNAITEIDAEWERISVGFRLSIILADNSLSLAKQVFEQTVAQRNRSFLGEEFFAEVYINCLRLGLRAVTGMMSYDDDIGRVKQELVDLIHVIPSVTLQVRLVADLALRHALSRRRDDFEHLIRDELLPLLEICRNPSDRMECLTIASACLYEYDPEWAVAQLKNLPSDRADSGLDIIIAYLITNTLPDDPVEMDSLKVNIDAKTARRVCTVIEFLSHDVSISSAIHELVTTLVRRHPNDSSREICAVLNERDALDIVDRLESIVNQKLPDPAGIQHHGYVVLIRGYINRLRAAAERRSRGASSRWQTLSEDARAINNIADRVYVLASLGEQAYRSEPSLGQTLIHEAEKLIPSIPNVLDRAGRFYSIARVWNKLERPEGARMLLQSAMATLKERNWDTARDEISEQILELAHSIDAEFASTLTPLIDNPIEEHEAKLNLTAMDLHKNPHKLEGLKKREGDPDKVRELLRKAAWNSLASLNSGGSHARHPKEIGQWLNQCIDGRFEDVFPVLAWSIQNNLLQTKQASVHRSSYKAVYDSLQLCSEVSQILLGIRSQNFTTKTLTLPDELLLFKAGQRADALLSIEEWLKTKVTRYLKIHDPYFTYNDLDILKHVATDVQVFIVSSWKAQSGISPGDRRIEQLYKKEWSRLSDQPPPWTQITITGIQSSGDSPLHSRYLVSEETGLNLGTSIGGLGKKHTDIRVLSPAEAAKIETEMINPELLPQLRVFRGERLIVFPFML